MERMNKMKTKTQTVRMLTGLAALMAATAAGRAQYAYTTIDYPEAVPGLGPGTVAQGISGTNIVGYYKGDDSAYHGFLYNGNNWTILDDPAAGSGSGQGTQPECISGTNILGTYIDSSNNLHGFLYNGISWTDLNDPLASPGGYAVGGTYPNGISGSNIIGTFLTNGYVHGFVYNGSSWTTLDEPAAGTAPTPNGGTAPQAIDGANIVGWYVDNSGISHGFLYNGLTWTTIDEPLAAPNDNGTALYGISGSSIVGSYQDRSTLNIYGCLYNTDSKNWLTLTNPLGVNGTVLNGISGANIVGVWWDGLGGINVEGGHEHGMVATPLPQLEIAHSGNSLTVAWPYRPWANWTLVQNSDLTTTNWTAVTGVSYDGTNNFITATPAPGNAFFRLKHQ
jgi:hypothetical protein